MEPKKVDLFECPYCDRNYSITDEDKFLAHIYVFHGINFKEIPPECFGLETQIGYEKDVDPEEFNSEP